MTAPDTNFVDILPKAVAWETGNGWVWKRLGATALQYTLPPGYVYQVIVFNGTMVTAGVTILAGGKESPGILLPPGESGMIRAIPVAPGAVVKIKPIMGQAATSGGKLTATVLAFPLA